MNLTGSECQCRSLHRAARAPAGAFTWYGAPTALWIKPFKFLNFSANPIWFVAPPIHCLRNRPPHALLGDVVLVSPEGLFRLLICEGCQRNLPQNMADRQDSPDTIAVGCLTEFYTSIVAQSLSTGAGARPGIACDDTTLGKVWSAPYELL